jgi:hypothetical protein
MIFYKSQKEVNIKANENNLYVQGGMIRTYSPELALFLMEFRVRDFLFRLTENSTSDR